MGDGAYNGSGSAALSVTGGGRARLHGDQHAYPVLVSTAITLNITVTGSLGKATGSLQIFEGAMLLNSLKRW